MQKVVIIGAGISGLCAGIYLQKAGFETEIYELHYVPGGLCTGWVKNHYTVDYCIHWLVGSKPGSEYNKIWEEVVPLNTLKFINPEVYGVFENQEGERITAYTDISRTEEDWLRISPEDAPEISGFMNAIRKLTHFNSVPPGPREVEGFMDKLKSGFSVLPFLPVIIKYSQITGNELANHFKHPLLQSLVRNLFTGEMPVLFFMMNWAWMSNGDAGYPLGGSMKLASLFAMAYRHAGGKIYYEQEVKRILHNNGKAIGIELENENRVYADFVVSAADAYSTFNKLLEGKFTPQVYAKYFSEGKTFPSLLFPAIGVDMDLSSEPPNLVFELRKPLYIDPETTWNELPVRFNFHDPNLAPRGKSVLTIMGETRAFDFWNDLRKTDFRQYVKEKERILKEIIQELNQRYPGFAEKVEMTDVSSPATVYRYTRNWKGSYEGWLINSASGFNSLPSALKGLSDFYLCGHWVQPGGGLPSALFTARNVYKLICHKAGVGRG